MLRKLGWFFTGFLCIGVAIYAFFYFFATEKINLLLSKPDELFQNSIWYAGFYAHVGFGGLALMVGWTQFSKKLRARYMKLHRLIGKFYVITCLLSGTAAVYIASYATGGLIPRVGFTFLGLIWLFTTLKAWISVRKQDFADHERMMIYSYAMCLAAVTLRIYLPLLSMGFGDFIIAYKIVAWLCWVPNLIVAFLVVRKKTQSGTLGFA